jgi:type IV secretory pathway TrbF-like protein
MPTIIEERLAKVKQAEVECEQAGLAARNSWQSLKEKSKEAATPWRIVAVGGVLGFLAGRGSAGGGTATAKLFGSLAQSLVTMLTAGATAGVAAGAAADAAAEATVDATAEAVEHSVEEVATATAKKAVEEAL